MKMDSNGLYQHIVGKKIDSQNNGDFLCSDLTLRELVEGITKPVHRPVFFTGSFLARGEILESLDPYELIQRLRHAREDLMHYIASNPRERKEIELEQTALDHAIPYLEKHFGQNHGTGERKQ